MANELAVKVKVNLDTSATKLKDDLKDLESNLQKNPIKIAVKIDKKSLTDSLKDAFGKEAADSIKKNLQSAFGVNAGKTIFDEMSSGADNITKKAQKVASILGELRKLQDKEKVFTLQYDGLKGSENRENELAVWKNRIDEVREEYQKLFAELNEYDEVELASGGFDNIAERLKQEKELYEARRADAELLAKSKTNTTSKYTSDEIKEEKVAIDQLITAQEKLDNLQVRYYNELKAGRTDNAVELVQPIQKASEELKTAKKNASDFGINISENKKYMDALADSTTKVAMAQNNANSTLSGNSIKEQASDEKAAIDQVITALKNRNKLLVQYYNELGKSGEGDNADRLHELVIKANGELGEAITNARSLGVAFDQDAKYTQVLNDGLVKVNNAEQNLRKSQNQAVNANNSLNASIDNTIEKANALNATTQKNGAGKIDMTAFNQAFQEFNDIANNTSGKYSDLKVKSDALQKSFQKMSIAAGNINTALKDGSAVTRANTNFANLNAQITRFLNNNPRISSNNGIYAQFQALATATEECSGDIDKLRMKEAQLEAQSERLGLTTETLAGKFSRLFKEHFQTAAVMAGIHLTQQGFQQVYQNVVEVDTAMTELKKVTDETDATYSSFMQTAIQQSRDLASSISDTVNATADFARLGYTLDEATDLSKAAITYQHVGDGISDISEATESIISTMKAFNIEAKDSMSIVDRFNKVGNEFAIFSSGIGEALQRSASALHTAGNDINESIGMIVAANDVVQDEESVGNALKVLSLRIRGAKTELKEMGEDTETVAESTSKLQASIKGLTGVDIMKSATEFKSTYQIMDELAAKWKELDDISKASTLEQLAGKNRANVVAGMLENWQDAKAAADAARDSYGSAEAELDKYKESIAGLSEQLKASFGALSETLLDDNIVKGLLKIATGISDATNEAIKFVGVLPTLAGALSGAFAVGGPKLTGSLYVPTNTLMVTWNELAA
nr:MAG TPA: minor tail protein [Caudoviricetes sp.]